MRHRIFLAILFFLGFYTEALERKRYNFDHEPIDVVVPCHSKDMQVLMFVLDGIKKHVKHRRLIVVAKNQLLKDMDGVELFCEADYPFSIEQISCEIFQDENAARAFIDHKKSRISWIYQQFLKLYAPLVIPGISSNVLIVDADTIFLRSVDFLNEKNEPLYDTGGEYHMPYFSFMDRLVPGLKKVYQGKSGVVHHMLLQKPVLLDMFEIIEQEHGLEPWRAMCRCIDHKELFGSCLSEYELYFNFLFSRTDQAHIRPLKSKGFPLKHYNHTKKEGFDYVSCHSWMV
jgi:hypothetical protein